MYLTHKMWPHRSFLMCFLRGFERIYTVIKFSDFALPLLFLVCFAFFESYIFRLIWKLHLNLLRCSVSRMTEDVLNVLWYKVPHFWRRPSCCWLSLYLWRSRTVVEMKVQTIYTVLPTPITAFSAFIITWAQVMTAMYLCSSCSSPFFSLRTLLCCLTCCYFLAHTPLPNFTVQ
jgi:hypothetical protein